MASIRTALLIAIAAGTATYFLAGAPRIAAHTSHAASVVHIAEQDQRPASAKECERPDGSGS